MCAFVGTSCAKIRKLAIAFEDVAVVTANQKEKETMKIGDRVRVVESVIVYHNPEQKKEPFDLKGMEGDVLDIIKEWHGRPVSANLPVLVQFSKKFRAHLRENEVEVI